MKQKVVQRLEHSPTLNTVLMVEDVLRKAGQLITIAELKRKLPRQVMHATLITVLEYLQISGKIVISPKGIVWVYTPREDLQALVKKGMRL